MQGMTLIEFLVVVAIVAIVAVIAVPNFQDYMTRSRRADAMTALQQLASEQEQFYFEQHRYAASLASINIPSLSPDGYYALSLSAVSATSFVAHALPVAGRSQAGDGGFEYRSDGRNGRDPDGDGVYQCEWHGNC